MGRLPRNNLLCKTDVTDWRVRTTKDTANRQFSKAWSGEWRKRSFPSSILDRRELQVAETRDHRGCWCGLGGGRRIDAIPHQAETTRAITGHPNLIGLRRFKSFECHAPNCLALRGIFAGNKSGASRLHFKRPVPWPPTSSPQFILRSAASQQSVPRSSITWLSRQHRADTLQCRSSRFHETDWEAPLFALISLLFLFPYPRRSPRPIDISISPPALGLCGPLSGRNTKAALSSPSVKASLTSSVSTSSRHPSQVPPCLLATLCRGSKPDTARATTKPSPTSDLPAFSQPHRVSSTHRWRT